MTTFNLFGYVYEIQNNTIQIGDVTIDLLRALEWKNEHKLTKAGEAARLYFSLLPRKERLLEDQILPARTGIDLNTATYEEITDFLNNPPIKISESERELMRKCMWLKSSTKFDKERKSNKVSKKLKTEYELICKEKTDLNTLGVCGGGKLGEVRLDGTTKHKSKFLSISKNGVIKKGTTIDKEN